MDDGIFRFRITSFTPETLPMKRLAEYMLELAKLLGEPERVHFQQLKKGSTVLVQKVDYPAVPVVRQRLTNVRNIDAPQDLTRPFRRIDAMLADDKAQGTMLEAGRRLPLLVFPGHTRVADTIPPLPRRAPSLASWSASAARIERLTPLSRTAMKPIAAS